MELTKDAQKLLSYIYQIYSTRKKDGQPKDKAIEFMPNFYMADNELSQWDESDIVYALIELKDAGYIRCFTDGEFELQNAGIAMMENRFKKGVKEAWDVVSKFIP